MSLPSQLAVWPTLEMFQKLRHLAKFLMGALLQGSPASTAVVSSWRQYSWGPHFRPAPVPLRRGAIAALLAVLSARRRHRTMPLCVRSRQLEPVGGNPSAKHLSLVGISTGEQVKFSPFLPAFGAQTREAEALCERLDMYVHGITETERL
jgi:hypothetical protein